VTTYNQYLLRNYNFSEWDSATAPSVWQQTSVTATTLSRLRETDRPDHPARAVFTRKPYIFDGGSSCRATLTAAAVAENFVLRQPDASAAGVLVQPGDKISITFAARCSVPGNALRVRIIGLASTTDTLYLEPVGNTAGDATNYNKFGQGFTWNSTARDIDLVMHDGWEVFGVQAEIPLGISSVAVRLGNGTAGAQVIDLGAVMFRELDRMRVA
jgi:hypothetical protein